MRDIEEFDEFELNSGYISECCGAPIYGEVTGDPRIGICSRCKEWSGAVVDIDEER